MKIPLRSRIALELGLLTILTIVFLLCFPRRPTYVDITLALLALALLGWNARFTRSVIWARFPISERGRGRAWSCLLPVAAMTIPVLLIFLGVGLALGSSERGWEGGLERLSNWHILLALALYFPWALLQQTLFQFYLLGRLLTLFPPVVAVSVTGVAYSLVHLPDVWVTLVTAAAGIFWTALYRRYRVLLPLALSHALLGSTFYYWVYGRDLFEGWLNPALR